MRAGKVHSQGSLAERVPWPVPEEAELPRSLLSWQMKKLDWTTLKQDFFKKSKSDPGSSSSHHREWVKGIFWCCFLFQQKVEWLQAYGWPLMSGSRRQVKGQGWGPKLSGALCSPNCIFSHKEPRLPWRPNHSAGPNPVYPPGPP